MMSSMQQTNMQQLRRSLDLDTKSLKTFTIQFDPFFSLHLHQQNNTQNHGTTVWDSAKLLSHYLYNSFKTPIFKPINGNDKHLLEAQNKKTCLELGSGCGLGGLLMASLGFHTVLTDLPDVIDRVLRSNCETATSDIQDWWYHLHHTNSDTILEPKIEVKSLDWFNLPIRSEEERYNYILASDCIYEIELVDPLLKCIKHYSDNNTITYISMERRDDKVVDGFIEKARALGFDAKMILKKLIQNHQNLICNEDVEIWKLKLKRRRDRYWIFCQLLFLYKNRV